MVRAPAVVVMNARLPMPVGVMTDGADLLLVYYDYVELIPPQRRLSALRIGPDGMPVSAPVSLFDNAWSYVSVAGDEVLFAARNDGGKVETIAVDAAGHAALPELVSIERSRQSSPILGTGGGDAVAVWTEWSRDTGSVRSATLSASGTPLSSRTVAENSMLASRDLAWNGAEFLMVIVSGGTARAQRLDRQGRAVGRAGFLAEVPLGTPRFAVAWAGDRWLVLWGSGNRVRIATVQPSGVVSSVVERPLAVHPSNNPPVVADIAVAFSGARGMLVWREAWAPICGYECIADVAAYAAEIDREGRQLSAPRLLADRYVESVDVATSGNGFAVVYDDSMQRGVDWIARTTVIFTSGTTTGFESPSAAGASIVWDGRNYVLAWRGFDRIMTRRLTENGADAGPSQVLGVPRPDISEAPGLAAAIPGEALIGFQQSPLTDPGVAMVIAESELEPIEQVRRRAIRP